MSYSQFKQDIKVLDFYNNKKNGFFVEIGAGDGILESNTYLLETQYDWKGICVEPVSYQYMELKKNRNCQCINKPIYNESNKKVVFYEAAESIRHLSGINTHLIKDTVEHNSKHVELETLSFNELLETCNAPEFIDYLSIDTEGSEYEILRTFDFNKYKFGYINIEHNYTEPKRSLIKNLLIQNNYTYIGENYVDDIYVGI